MAPGARDHHGANISGSGAFAMKPQPLFLHISINEIKIMDTPEKKRDRAR